MKRLFSLLLCTVMLFSGLILYTQAASLDLTQKGSISLTLTYNKQPVTDGKLTVYRVASISQENGVISYSPTQAFPIFPSNGNVTSPALAKTLADYAAANKRNGTQISVDSTGKAVAKDLTVGVYLVVQTDASTGYSSITPFLVTVPVKTQAGYDYSVDASPKTSITPEPTESTEPEATKPTTPGKPTGGNRLPQTGMVNWPVPVLALLGLILFLAGWRLYRSGRRERYEN